MRWWVRWIPVGLVIAMALLFWHPWNGFGGQISPDEVRYLALSRQPFGSSDIYTQDPPYCWRVLVPIILYLTHVPFPVLTLIGLIGTILALQWLLAGWGFSQEMAIAGSLSLVLLVPVVGVQLTLPFLIDPVAVLFLVLGMAAAVYRRGKLLLVMVILGTLTKETELLAAVFALAWALEHRDRDMWRWSAASLIACLLTIVLLHRLIPADIPYGYFNQVFLTMGFPDATGNLPERLLAATAGTWGILLPFAIWYVSRSGRIRLSMALVLVGATAQIMVGSDVERTVVYGFPVLLALAMHGVQHAAERWRVSPWTVWSGIWLLQLLPWRLFQLPVPTWWQVGQPANHMLTLKTPGLWFYTLGMCGVTLGVLCVLAWTALVGQLRRKSP